MNRVASAQCGVLGLEHKRLRRRFVSVLWLMSCTLLLNKMFQLQWQNGVVMYSCDWVNRDKTNSDRSSFVKARYVPLKYYVEQESKRYLHVQSTERMCACGLETGPRVRTGKKPITILLQNNTTATADVTVKWSHFIYCKISNKVLSFHIFSKLLFKCRVC